MVELYWRLRHWWSFSRMPDLHALFCACQGSGVYPAGAHRSSHGMHRRGQS